ncbi:MAG: LicD family protein [Maribacter sp.]|nr:LicD family protein [Maribacter sp.]
MAYDITLEGKNLVEAEKLLSDVITVFESCHITYWLEGGTLLGLRREGRLLPWDDDLDISIHESEKSKLKRLEQNLRKKGFRFRIRKFQRDSDHFKKGDLRMIKIRNKHFFGLIKGKVCLDIFIKYTKNGKTYWEIANKVKNVPSKYYSSFSSLDFNGKSYSIPKLTDEYLTYRYGDWQTPVKDWDTSKDDKALI